VGKIARHTHSLKNARWPDANAFARFRLRIQVSDMYLKKSR
jgi:hypothetical protein